MIDDDLRALVDAAAAAVPPGDAAKGDAASSESEAGRMIASLEHSIHHLQRSNRELEEHMKEFGNDKTLREAIGENILVIARRKAQLEDLRKQAGLPATPAPTAVPMVAAAEPPTALPSVDDAMAVDVSEAR